MHSYTLAQTDKRIEVISLIAIISAFSTPVIEPLAALLPSVINQIVEPVSPFVIFAFAFLVFDRWLWKSNIVQVFWQVPNFEGTWKGYGYTTSQKLKGEKFDVTLKIKQTFTEIMITGEFSNSLSESFMAHIDSSNPSQEKLVYSYKNEPYQNQTNMDKHSGTVNLSKISKRKLVGNYFTDRLLQTKGKLELKRVNDGDSD